MEGGEELCNHDPSPAPVSHGSQKPGLVARVLLASLRSQLVRTCVYQLWLARTLIRHGPETIYTF